MDGFWAKARARFLQDVVLASEARKMSYFREDGGPCVPSAAVLHPTKGSNYYQNAGVSKLPSVLQLGLARWRQVRASFSFRFS